MYINEYGNQDKPKLILLAPMMVSGEDLHRLMSPYLTGEYFIIAPDQGGHGRAGNYISADDEYTQLKRYLLEKGYTKIKLIYGASLGVAVAYRLFLDPDFNVSHEHKKECLTALKQSEKEVIDWILQGVTRR